MSRDLVLVAALNLRDGEEWAQRFVAPAPYQVVTVHSPDRARGFTAARIEETAGFASLPEHVRAPVLHTCVPALIGAQR